MHTESDGLRTSSSYTRVEIKAMRLPIMRRITKSILHETDWQGIQNAYVEYSWLMKNPFDLNNEYKKRYTSFYNINLGLGNEKNKTVFYNILKESLTHNNFNYENILNRLSKRTGKNEMSYSSKIVATVNPHKPVIDSRILAYLGLARPSYGDLTYRAKMSVLMYNDIEKYYEEFLASDTGVSIIKDFDSKISQSGKYKLTAAKKLDLMIWKSNK